MLADKRRYYENRIRQLNRTLFYMKLNGQVNSEEFVRIQKEMDILLNYRDKLDAGVVFISKL